MMPHSKYYEEFFYFWIPKNPFVWEESYYTNLVGSKIYVYSKQGYLSFNSFACGQFWVKWLTMQEKENGFALHCVQRVVVIAIKYCTLTKIRGSKIRFSFIYHENCAWYLRNKNGGVPLRFPWNCPEVALRLTWGCPEIVPWVPRSCPDIDYLLK